MEIEFIDRQLGKEEKYHHRCRKCRQYIPQDLTNTHECPAIPSKSEFKVKISEAKRAILG